jgi:hypothetical protein
MEKAMETSSFENFPWWMVLVCNAVGLAIYAIGFCLMTRLGILWGVVYAAYCVWVEWRILSRSCRYCFYFGKRCGFGKGRVCSWFFRKGSEQTLCTKRITWLDVVPDFMVTLVPLGVGITMLIRDFSLLALFLIIVLVFLGSVGTALVRRQLACKYCRQRELGCPAEQLFSTPRPAGQATGRMP